MLDPACGSGHFLLEAFDLLSAMYQEEDLLKGLEHPPTPEDVAASILNKNLFAIDIDGRAIQIAIAALWIKAKEYAPNLDAASLIDFHNHLISTDIRLPKDKDHLKTFLAEHPDATPLRPALETIFEGLQNVDVLGSLVQIEEPVEKELRYLKEQYDTARGKPEQLVLFSDMRKPRQGELPLGIENYEHWKANIINDLEKHFSKEAEVVESARKFFGYSIVRGLSLFSLLSRRYCVVTANPPYMGFYNMGR